MDVWRVINNVGPAVLEVTLNKLAQDGFAVRNIFPMSGKSYNIVAVKPEIVAAAQAPSLTLRQRITADRAAKGATA